MRKAQQSQEEEHPSKMKALSMSKRYIGLLEIAEGKEEIMTPTKFDFDTLLCNGHILLRISFVLADFFFVFGI